MPSHGGVYATWEKGLARSHWSCWAGTVRVCGGECVSTTRYDNDMPDRCINQTGRRLLQLCSDLNCIVGNHANVRLKRFAGNLSFKKSTRWISEIDLCILSTACVDLVSDIRINQDTTLPSDHGPLELSIPYPHSINLDNLTLRANKLGDHVIGPAAKTIMIAKGPALDRVDVRQFSQKLQDIHPPVPQNPDADLTWLTDTINNTAKAAPRRQNQVWDQTQPRWSRLLACNDSRTIWKAVGWNGLLSESRQPKDMPSDDEFKAHFESLLKPEVTELEVDLGDSPYIPCLDDPITSEEVQAAVDNMKAASYIGVASELLRLVPATLMIFLCSVFNVIFQAQAYPTRWTYSKLVTLFKKGSSVLCGNYRGIAVSDTLSKLYDTVINNRLRHWIAIDKTQAGAQKGRGCIEQILTLRLLIDLCKYRHWKLYIVFADFCKAYDKVPRHKLLNCLRLRGCGARMLLAIWAMYKCTRYVLRSAVISATVGVRQGASTSCLLFALYVDFLVRTMKERYASDGFLGTLHMLLLMDDTVILATTRQAAAKKFQILLDYCSEFGMRVNEQKTKLMVINGSVTDRTSLTVGTMTLGYTDRYVYLGGHFTDDGQINS